MLERAPVRYSTPPSAFGRPTLLDEYRPEGFSNVLHGNQVSDDHNYNVVDLHACGLTLCTLGWIMNPYLHAFALTCGAASTAAATITLHEPPKLRAAQ